MRFKTELTKPELWIHGMDVQSAHIEITWGVEFETRDYGIKSTIITIKDFTLQVENENGGGFVSTKKDFEVVKDIEMIDGEISITSADVDLREGTITFQ